MDSNNNNDNVSDTVSTFLGSTTSTARKGNLFKKAVSRKIENGDVVFERVEGRAGCHYIRLPQRDIDPECQSSNQYATMS